MEAQKPKEMLLIEPPNELRFSGPFNVPVVTMLKLFNPSNQLMLFKIKTTAPKRYCVRPNFGSVRANSSTAVEICLQPFQFDPLEKNKHKFMVQSLVAPDENGDVNKMWKDASQDQFMDAKLRCVFEAPATAAIPGTSTGGNADIKMELEPKSMGEEKISNLVSSEQTEPLMDELRQLRDENCGLRKENINLKDQMLRLRVSQSKPPMDEPYAPMLAEKQIPMFYIAISIAAAIFGLLLGKYLL